MSEVNTILLYIYCNQCTVVTVWIIFNSESLRLYAHSFFGLNNVNMMYTVNLNLNKAVYMFEVNEKSIHLHYRYSTHN